MKNTEQELKKLFDYQRFEQNEKLEKMIRETENWYTRELSDEELSFVNAAGDITVGTISNGETQVGEITGDFVNGNEPK